jgi:hypothetical protein
LKKDARRARAERLAPRNKKRSQNNELLSFSLSENEEASLDQMLAGCCSPIGVHNRSDTTLAWS